LGQKKKIQVQKIAKKHRKTNNSSGAPHFESGALLGERGKTRKEGDRRELLANLTTRSARRNEAERQGKRDKSHALTIKTTNFGATGGGAPGRRKGKGKRGETARNMETYEGSAYPVSSFHTPGPTKVVGKAPGQDGRDRQRVLGCVW